MSKERLNITTRNSVFRIVAFCLAVQLTGAPALGAGEAFLFERHRFACVMKNVEDYLRADTDPVLVFLDFCPELEITSEMLLSMSRNAMPNLAGSVDTGGGARIERVFSFTKNQLKCLAGEWNAGALGPADAEEKTLRISNLCGIR